VGARARRAVFTYALFEGTSEIQRLSSPAPPPACTFSDLRSRPASAGRPIPAENGVATESTNGLYKAEFIRLYGPWRTGATRSTPPSNRRGRANVIRCPVE